MKELLSLTFLPLLFSSYQAMGQRSSSGFSLVVSPALFVPVSVAAQGGIQYRTSKRFCVLAEAAVPLFYPDNTGYEEINYFRTGLEFKYFMRSDSASSKYVSLQNNYLFREFYDADPGVYYTQTQTFSYANAFVSSPVLSTALKLGMEVNAGRKTFVDIFIGAGLRFIFNEYTAKNALATSAEPPDHNFFSTDDAWKYNYTLTRLHATAGIRFGLRL